MQRALPARAARSGPGRKPLPMEDLALAFITGILAGAQKLAQVAHLRVRADPMVAPLLAIERVASQSSFTRFFARFGNAAVNDGFKCTMHWPDPLRPLVGITAGLCQSCESMFF